jgi:hypothetical protein
MRSGESMTAAPAAGRVTGWSRAGRPLGLVALVMTGALAAVGCGASSDLRANARQDAGTATEAARQGSAPVMVNCGEGQRAMVKQVVLDGQAVQQVDCVTAQGAQPAQVQAAPLPAAPPMAPVQYAPAYAPQDYHYTLASPQVYPAPAPRPAVVQRTQPQRVVYSEPRTEVRREVPRKQNRSWQKSAIIIGSSAGVGAGVGGAVGGKKGALIGAAVGGGSATIWDQATRK